MTAAENSYTLDNTWAKAHRRLTLIEEMCDPGTTARLSALGVGPGWRCLELGAGAGSVARWLADRVGSAGEVVAVDLEPRFLLADGRPNLTVVQQDIVNDGIPGDGYDLVHARALLMHLPSREKLIGELLAKLRPGGAILLEDADFFPTLALGDGPLREVVTAACEAVASVGGDWYWPRHTPHLLTRAGAVDVQAAFAELPMLCADGPMAEFFRLTMEQLTPLVLARGVPAATVEAALAQIAEPGYFTSLFALVATSGRRRAGAHRY